MTMFFKEFAMPLFERAANPKTAVASAAEINSIFQYIGSCMKVRGCKGT